MPPLRLLADLHTRTPRDYLSRVIGVDKAECATVARRFDQDFWDGERKYGYGGYRYDGRWRSFAERLLRQYRLPPRARVLDVGCGKGFLLYDLLQVAPTLRVTGLDFSSYALTCAPDSIRPYLIRGTAFELPWPDHTFDLVISVNVLHNFRNFELYRSLREIERVARGVKYIVVDSYRTEQEKVNLLYWQLTCSCFYTPEEWQWIFDQSQYTGDFEFLFYS